MPLWMVLLFWFGGLLNSIKKQAEDARRRKPVGSTPPWPLHLLLHPASCQTSLFLQQYSNGNSNQNREYAKKKISIGALFIGVIIIDSVYNFNVNILYICIKGEY